MMFCDEHGTADYCGECVYGPQIAELQQQLTAAQAEVQRLEPRAAIGAQWQADSSLETWFPYTAEQLAAAQAEAVKWELAAYKTQDALRELSADHQAAQAELSRVRGLCPEVIAFAHLMQRKLDANARKDGAGWDRDGAGKRGWKGCDPRFLLGKLDEEVEELKVAIALGDSAKASAYEAADVANIAMMLTDTAGGLDWFAKQVAYEAGLPHRSQPAEPEGGRNYIGDGGPLPGEPGNPNPSFAQMEAAERGSLPLMARRPEHKDDDLGELYENGKRLCTISGELPLRKPMPGFVLYRITDTDEHGLPVIPRTADMPEGTKYAYASETGGGWSAAYEPSIDSVWQRIEDYQHGQEGRE